MEVVGQEDEGGDLDSVAALGAGQGAQDDLVEEKVGQEQEAALYRAAGNLGCRLLSTNIRWRLGIWMVLTMRN